jgi:hypothetical protein
MRKGSRNSTGSCAAVASGCSSHSILLWPNGRDLRGRSLVDRQPNQAAWHSDLEGIVAKSKWGAYRPDPGSNIWIKIKNPPYSRAAGRHEQFTRYRRFSLDPITAIHSAAGGD